MRMSCNGCRVLRKGCRDNCSIRPCLQWIKNPEAQGNATLFLAKFYGRAGLLNLINAGTDHLRPAIFRSLLYEACGRIVNPTYGSVGLLWSGRWQLCQAAVEAVLKGAPIMQISSEITTGAADSPLPPLHKASSYDIRHIGKAAASASASGHDLHKVFKPNRTPFKRSGLDKPIPPLGIPIAGLDVAHIHDSFRWSTANSVRFQREPSHDSSATQASDPVGAPGAAKNSDGDSRENESAFSVETVDASMVTNHGLETWKTSGEQISEETEVDLELTLGFESMHGSHSPHGSSGNSHGHQPTPSRREPRPEQCFLMAVGGFASLAGRIHGST